MPAKRELATTVMGLEVSLPVLISPTGVQAVHPDGEVAVARPRPPAARRWLVVLCQQAGRGGRGGQPQDPLPGLWVGTRHEIARRIERARAAGAVGLIATLDWSFANGRDWGSPFIPDRLDLKTMAGWAPEAVIRPAWLLEFARSGALPGLIVPNMTMPDEEPLTFFGAYGQWMQTPPPTWDDVRRGCASCLGGAPSC